jgi:hypothetical protein
MEIRTIAAPIARTSLSWDDAVVTLPHPATADSYSSATKDL